MNNYNKYIDLILDFWFGNGKLNFDMWFKNGSKYDQKIIDNFIYASSYL